MDVARMLALFDEEVRANPSVMPGFSLVRIGGVTGLRGPFNFVTSWDLNADEAAAAVAAQVADARSRRQGLHWRL